MPHARTLRLSLPSTAKPLQPSLLHQYMTPSSPLQPPTPRLKSPAFILTASDNYHYPSFSLSSPRRFSEPQPSSPLAWTWRCHLCYTTYRLGTTRRCLLDGHYFCSNPPPPPPSPSSLPEVSPTTPTSPTKLIAPLPLAKRGAYVPCAAGEGKPKNGRGRRCKKGHESCTSSFDYLGWVDWNAWRRELSPVVARPRLPRSRGLRTAAMCFGEGLAEKEKKDCFRYCDFPSECSWQQTCAYIESVLEEESPVSPF